MKKKAKGRADQKAAEKAGELTDAELEQASGGTGSSGDMAQIDSTQLQALMDQSSKAAQTLSNIMKKMSDTKKGIISNLK